MNAAATVPVEIASFAASVRAALSDLPADELDDLTEGLEADLAEAYAEDLARELPDPVEYAAELRSAAGLPVRATSGRGPVDLGRAVAVKVAGARERTERAVRENRMGAAGLGFLADALPVWWVVRAWVLFAVVRSAAGAPGAAVAHDTTDWVALIAAAFVSIQVGRRAWAFRGLAPVVLLANVVAVVGFLPAVGNVRAQVDELWAEASRPAGQTTQVEVSPEGLYSDGIAVPNLFVYDAKGRPLRDVQLFTPDGEPVRASAIGGSGCLRPDCESTGFWSPAVLADGSRAWNVFPMRMIEGDPGFTSPLPDAVPQAMKAPFAKAPSVDREASGKRSALAVVLQSAGYQVSDGNQ